MEGITGYVIAFSAGIIIGGCIGNFFGSARGFYRGDARDPSYEQTRTPRWFWHDLK